MPNTNFQTFHQMGQAINEVVRQATGRDNVQNIDMEHITVAQNHYYQDVDVSGGVVSFHAGAAGLPLEKCVVQIEPVQDLHGYDYPWPAGGGKNLLNNTAETTTNNGITFTVNSDGTVSTSGTANGTSVLRIYQTFSATSDLIISGCPSGGDATNGYSMIAANLNGSGVGGVDTGNGGIIPAGNISAVTQIQIIIRNGTNVNGKVFKPMIRLATETDATFAPYSNICPITGWTGANVYVSPTTDAADGQTYTIAFPSEAGTVYGGTLDAVTGKLVVDRAEVELGNLNFTKYDVAQGTLFRGSISGIKTLSSVAVPNMICSMYPVTDSSRRTNKTVSQATGLAAVDVIDDDYSDADTFKTAMSGVQLVYELATPVTYTFTPQEVTTLLGLNHVWADTGDIEVKFKDLKELY